MARSRGASPRRFVRLVTHDDRLGRESDNWHTGLAIDIFAESRVPARFIRAEVFPKNGPSDRGAEREYLCSASEPDVLTPSGCRVPVNDADRAAGLAPEILGKRRAADDPESVAVPYEPDGRVPGPKSGIMRQVGIERAGEKLIEVKDLTIPGGNRSLDDPHDVVPQRMGVLFGTQFLAAN